MLRYLISVSAVTLMTVPALAEPIAGSQFSFGNWSGSAYSFDDTGRFSHCVISASYKSGNTLLFSVNNDASVTVAVAGNLGLQQGQQFPVALYVDRRAPFYGTATAFTDTMAALKISDFDGAMEAFRKGYVLRIEALGGVTEYSLDGTFRALQETTACAVRHLDYAANNSSNGATQQDKTTLFQISTMVISDLGIDRFRYLSEAELMKKDWGAAVAWEAEDHGMSGLIVSVPREGMQNLRDTDAYDTQFIAKECAGDYATFTRGVNLESGKEDARELRLVCQAEKTQSEFFLTKFFAGDEIFYTLIKFDGTEKNSDTSSRSEASKNAALKAASFVLE